MNTLFSIVFLLLIIWAVLEKKHRVLVAISVLSVFADAFRLDLGPSLLLINLVGYFLIPFIASFYFDSRFASYTEKIRYVLKPLWLNFLYLMVLGFIFGFLSPWTDESSYRTWTQQAPGRTVVTLLRYLNEFFIAIYLFIVMLTSRVTLRYIVTAIGWVSFISICVALIEFSMGPIIKTVIFDSPNLLSGRFIGLNGEPKILGRNSALAYIILLLYYLKIGKDSRILFFIAVNIIGVLISLSASAYIMFALFHIYLLIDRKSFKALIIFSVFSALLINVLKDNPFFTNTTSQKINSALFGGESETASVAESVITRFDIFDHLALLFLYENPWYLVTGTGPNLISIPSSQYLNNFERYSTYAEIGGIDSVPNVLFNNVLANTGVLGIVFFTAFFFRIYKVAKSHDSTGFSKNLVVINLIFNMVYFSVVLMFLTGIIVGFSYSKKRTTSQTKILNLIP